MPNNEQLSFLDIITIISFIIGVANYNENVSQGVMQDAIETAVKDIHDHLQEQDEKLDWILSLLEVKE